MHAKYTAKTKQYSANTPSKSLSVGYTPSKSLSVGYYYMPKVGKVKRKDTQI